MKELLVKYHEINPREDYIIFNNDKFLIECIRANIPHRTLVGEEWLCGSDNLNKGDVYLDIVNFKTKMTWSIRVPLDYDFKILREG